MNDLVIRGGKVVDGSGAAAFIGDVAIKGGVITEVANRERGEQAGAGAREIDADGLLVTPGWVDIHTHYDAQATWDPYFTPSSWHGVTSVVMGNCGVGFAPAHTDQASRDTLIDLMEGVEDIPGAALTEGMEWSWETYPEFLDAVEAKPHVLDFGSLVPHGAVRAYVMGERGVHNEDASAEDIARMARIVRDGIKAGALGFSTSRTSIHKAKSTGEHVPGTYAAMDEVFGLGMALKEAGAGVFQMAIEHHEADENFSWMKRLAQETGRPVLFNLVQADKAPDLWREMLKKLDEAGKEGIPIYGQTAGRPVGLLYNWRASVHPFALTATWQAMKDLPWDQMLPKLKDPATRAAMCADEVMKWDDFVDLMMVGHHKMFPLGPEQDYEPGPEKSVEGIAKATGQSPREIIYDALMRDDGEGIVYFPLFNYSNGSFDVLEKLIEHPRTGLSLSDGGAHCATITDASIPTFMITHWTRDRSRGPKFALEQMVRMQTRDTARLFGLYDRGLIAPGYRADVNIIDYDKLALGRAHMVWDLPTGAKRYVQGALGYVATICGGTPTYENGEATGALPGKLIRGQQAAPMARAAE